MRLSFRSARPSRRLVNGFIRQSPLARFLVDCRRSLYTNNSFLKVSEEVQDALQSGRPVVALETTIYTHGFPYPENVALASHLESVVRVHGGVPATVGVLNGVARVGLGTEELIELTASAGKPDTLKGHTGRKLNGGTTIAGTMVLAHLAGIKVFATGGLGGVHRGGENSLDISADLTELGRTPVTVISSGCKSFLDIPRTLEYLETQGVGVGTFADGREGKVDFPAFWTRESGVKSPMTIKDEAEAAAIIHAQGTLPVMSGLHFANPIPVQHSIAKVEMDTIIAEAIREADRQGASGRDNTPFILRKIKELTGGRSIPANRALIESNVIRGTKVALELAKLESKCLSVPDRHYDPRSNSASSSMPPPQHLDSSTGKHEGLTNPTLSDGASSHRPVDILVAGSLAVDFSCDYTPLRSSTGHAPQLSTSNPAAISQTTGGVGYNIAVAAQQMRASVRLCSVVADDLCGRAALATMNERGMQTGGITILAKDVDARTAQYIAVNDAKKDLMLAMADMRILEISADLFLERLKPQIQDCKPTWLVVDANWEHDTLKSWIIAAKASKAKVALEPVSAAKAARIFTRTPNLEEVLRATPGHTIDIATPNSIELAAMHTAAREADLFERLDWWKIIDSMGMPPTGSRHKLVAATNNELVDQGVPQQSIQLLPFIPCILTKLGPGGVLMTQLLRPGDERLTSTASAPYILSRSHDGNSVVGGIYMRLFPPAEIVPNEEVVSVNGVGDTFLGIIVAGLATGRVDIEELVNIAQRGSIRTLRSKEAVSPDLAMLRPRMGI
ncbi:MAG: hypothetical protein M1830_005933 [Pleopsidium flavum]|nr:MAG: hypothetical protein M1830_005933 [Pleopsidium flavum]